jgi:hypothetical protein
MDGEDEIFVNLSLTDYKRISAGVNLEKPADEVLTL